MPFRSAALLLVSGLCLSPAASAASGPRIASLESSCATVHQFERCELTLRLEGDIANPYDPDDVAVEAEFRPEAGAPVRVEGFHYEPYELSGEGGREQLRSAGPPVWKVRFAPRRLGRWHYEVTVTTPSGAERRAGGPFLVVGSGDRGFVQLDRAGRRLQFETGAPYIPIGESLCWGTRREYEQWIRQLGQQRANYIRVWMAPWSLGIETRESGLGRYDQRRAWLLDRLFEQSEAAGLYWQLCLLNHGSFSQSEDADWHGNPYNLEHGGMCRLPNDFLRDPQAIAMYQRQLRYIVSRWGAHRHLAVWELFNEGDLGEFAMEDLIAWTARTSEFLRTLDPYGRPITTSFNSASPEAVWRLPAIDIVQLHLYDRPDFVPAFTDPAITQLADAYGKPVLVGEFGWTDGAQRKFDDIGIHFHDGLWASLMGGSLGTALVWYWDSYVHPNRLERHFRGLEAFWRDESLGSGNRRTGVAISDAGLAGWGIGTKSRMFLWIKNRAHTIDRYLAYRGAAGKQRLLAQRGEAAEPVSYAPEAVRGATATIEGLERSARYRVEWWDPYRGRVIGRAVGRSDAGAMTVQVPDVSFDVAGKLIKLQWWERG